MCVYEYVYDDRSGVVRGSEAEGALRSMSMSPVPSRGHLAWATVTHPHPVLRRCRPVDLSPGEEN